MKRTFEEISAFYANKCPDCRGSKRIKVLGIWTACSCQYTATICFRFEQIPITPASLKYKTWSDFTGEIKDLNKKGELEVIGQLDPALAVAAKKKAMMYCFGSSDPKVVEDRQKNLIIHQHVNDGQNVIIIGNRQTGRSLLANLILKEVVYATALNNLSLDFRWLKASELLHAARWDDAKSINHSWLDEMAMVDFLVLDGVDVPKQGYGHTGRADLIALDVFFRERRSDLHPTIVVCSDEFWSCVKSRQYIDLVYRSWGDEFVDLVTAASNVIIPLQKKVKNGSDQ